MLQREATQHLMDSLIREAIRALIMGVVSGISGKVTGTTEKTGYRITATMHVAHGFANVEPIHRGTLVCSNGTEVGSIDANEQDAPAPSF